MLSDTEMDNYISELTKSWELNEVNLPVMVRDEYKIPIFKLLNDTLLKTHHRGELLLPNFSHEDTVMIFSDYGGEKKGSACKTYSFLFAGRDSLQLIFTPIMKKIREKYFEFQDKEIGFKCIEERSVANSLSEYLAAANNFINGLLFTLIVDSNIKSLFGDTKENARALEKINGQKWKHKVLEKEMRVLFILAYFLRLLVPDGKKIFWLTDEDDIVANDEISQNTAELLGNLLSNLSDFPHYSIKGYGTAKNFKSEKELDFKDALSLTDLVAGSLEHYFTQQMKYGDEFQIKDGGNKVLKWMSLQGVGIKHLTIKVSLDKETGNFCAGRLNLKLKEPMDNVRFIDIPYPTQIL